MSTPDFETPLNEARAVAGSSAALGRRLGVTSQAVSQWKRVPVERVLDVERETGVPRHRLRPDIYPEPAQPEAV